MEHASASGIEDEDEAFTWMSLKHIDKTTECITDQLNRIRKIRKLSYDYSRTVIHYVN